MWKNVHPVNSTGIQTHNLWNMSLLPLPLDQGFHPRGNVLDVQVFPKQWLFLYEKCNK